MHKLSQAQYQYFTAQLDSIKEIKGQTNVALKVLRKLHQRYFDILSEYHERSFTNFFSKLVYCLDTFNFPRSLVEENHNFVNPQGKDKVRTNPSNDLILNAIQLMQNNIDFLYLETTTKDQPVRIKKRIEEPNNIVPIISGLIKSINLSASSFNFIDQDDPLKIEEIHFDHIRICSHLLFTHLHKYFKLPLAVKLIEVKKESSVISVETIVIDPDFLINITSISEGFKSNETLVLESYLLRKLIPTYTTGPILKGNIVNFFLDKLVHAPELEFKNIFSEIFKLYPLVFSAMSDVDLRKMLADLEQHFKNLKDVVSRDFPNLSIEADNIYLEPSFYSNSYGLQGRLDIFHSDNNSSRMDIVELKSGKIFKPNVYDICNNHYYQTLLYGLLTERISSKINKHSLYILYSSQAENALRAAPEIREKQLIAIQKRNEIRVLEQMLCEGLFDQIIKLIDPAHLKAKDHFVRRDATTLYSLLDGLDILEKEYYKNFIRFVSNEYKLSKTGTDGLYTRNGLAGIWLDDLDKKVDDFSVLSYLKIKENKADKEDAEIVFGYSEKSNYISKFRQGDIAVIYPYYGNQEELLDNQIFKCNIIDITDRELRVKFRYQQKNLSYFERFEYWNIEYDILDSSFKSAFNGLFHFISANKDKRDLLLSRSAPKQQVTETEYVNLELTDEQQTTISEILNSEDYYLLWGPPGTGKTSFVLKHLIKELYFNTSENILVLAYTNRSVDEICAAIETIDLDFKNYIRLGSRMSVGESYKNQLLSKRIETIESRSELRKLILDHKIFVSTVASINNNLELFRLKQFDTIIVDEASQILEPDLIGLLPKSKRFVLIGDHKQLPAVVTQAEKKSVTKDGKSLEQIGITDLRTSLFERMYKQAMKNEWKWALGILTKQGRMHKQIMELVSKRFYENQLQLLPEIDRLRIPLSIYKETEKLHPLLKERVIFIDAKVDLTGNFKVNNFEAKLVVKLISELINNLKYKEGKSTKRIGVITPFRAQIAQILKHDSEGYIKKFNITVDTVERYQGSARDIIILSLVANSLDQFRMISNVSKEGIDRKLNVAITRAKEQIILIGNRDILATNDNYAAIMESAAKLEYGTFFDGN